MSKLNLNTTTLICVDCVDAKRAVDVLEICKYKVDFAEVKLLTSQQLDYKHCVEIRPLTTLVMYSIFCLTELYKYIVTPNLLIVQKDGWILSAESFKQEWLELDFIGPIFVQHDCVGSGGFSLRSKRIMEYAAHILPKWNGTEEHANELQKGLGYYEDGVLCLDKKFKHFKHATLEQGADFASGGNRNPLYHRSQPFGFHRTHQTIDFNTGMVDINSDNIHLKNSYDNEIEMLTKNISR